MYLPPSFRADAAAFEQRRRGHGGASPLSPTVTPISTIVAPAASRNFSAAFEASVVFVVPNGSTQADGM